MARSPFTLVAAVTSAAPGAEVVGARALTSNGDGRFDSAIATLSDGSELVIRVAEDDTAALELAEEALALRALTAGARELLPFQAPTFIGETHVGTSRALVTDLMPGFQIEAMHIPEGRGAAPSIGEAIAAVHALPLSVVRSAGLTVRDAAGVRDDLRELIDRAAATGKVPARLTVRWRDAVTDDDLWRFETAVTLGGLQALSFLFEDDPDDGPQVVGILGWRGLTGGDPAEDLGWVSGAPDAADDILDAYATASTRASDDALRVRARLHAELEFARWLVHGEELRRDDIIEDAAALLESLAAGLRDDDLRVTTTYTGGVDSALDVLERTPTTEAPEIDTSMQTDAYRPDQLWQEEFDEADSADEGGAAAGEGEAGDGGRADESADSESAAPAEHHSWDDATEDLTEVSAVRGSSSAGPAGEDDGASAATEPEPQIDPAEEAQRAARAALHRWTNSDSE